MKKPKLFIYVVLLLLLTAAIITGLLFFRESKAAVPEQFGIGRPASPEKIKALDIDIMPDGRGLPEGSGNIQAGRLIYNTKCLACHGNGAETDNEVLGGPLFTGSAERSRNKDTAGKKERRAPKTIGTYWPYATTIFDYVRRAMPYDAPGSLTDAEVYHLTAYLLYQNHIISAETPVNAETLPGIVMPNRKNYIDDDRKGGTELK